MKTSQVVLTTLSVLGVAGLGYAAYFDYRRRNDAAFRKSLIKDGKKTTKASKKDAAKKTKAKNDFIDELLKETQAPGAFPSNVEEREQYFLKYVTIGEQLGNMGPDHYLEAAGAYFHAVKVYPSPVEIIMILQKAVPKEIFDTVMLIISKDVASGEQYGAGNLDEVDEDAPSPIQGRASELASQPAGSSAAQQQGTDSGTTSSQEWDTLSATSLTDTGVVVTPGNQTTKDSTTTSEALSSASDPPEVPVTEATSSSSPTSGGASEWTPAPVFGGSQ